MKFKSGILKKVDGFYKIKNLPGLFRNHFAIVSQSLIGVSHDLTVTDRVMSDIYPAPTPLAKTD
jgi:hypothetical protein